MPAKTKVFISFDYDHDLDLKTLLVGQGQHADTPFEIIDMSVKEELAGDWKSKVRARVKRVEQIIVICGENTDTASGVNAEIMIAQEENVPYFLLWGRNGKTCRRPKSAKADDKIYNWSWDNLKSLLAGNR